MSATVRTHPTARAALPASRSASGACGALKRCSGAPALVRLRVIATASRAPRALELLRANHAVINLVHLRNVSQQPAGDVIECDVTRDEATDVVSDLRELGVDRDGAISLQGVDSKISAAGRDAVSCGESSRAVVWEEVEARTSQSAELSASYLIFMVLATLIAPRPGST